MMVKRFEQIKNWADGRLNLVILVFVIFYSVGVAGFIYPRTSAFFAELTPLILIMSFIAVIIYHDGKGTLLHILVLTGVFLFSFVAEAIGVNTGIIFGSYNYGDSLGFRIFDTPLLIGLNWVFLVYSSASIIRLTKLSGKNLVIAPSLIMVVYDLILEQVAGVMGMWTWTGGSIPIKNYITWFVLAVVFHWLVKHFRVPTSNKIAPAIFTIQFLFFVVILLLKGVVS